VMRLVLDTNVVMSALFWDGAPRRVLDAGDRGDAILITSGRLIAELRTVLSRDKFAGRISEARQTVGNLVESYALRTISVVPTTMLSSALRSQPKQT
jgi:predicted nucleic acid-binding protein